MIVINGKSSVLMVHVATAGAKVPSAIEGETSDKFLVVKMFINVGKLEIVGALARTLTSIFYLFSIVSSKVFLSQEIRTSLYYPIVETPTGLSLTPS